MRDLAALGYAVEWDCISAANVGANHIRDRIWILAHAMRGRSGGSVAKQEGVGDGLQGNIGGHGEVGNLADTPVIRCERRTRWQPGGTLIQGRMPKSVAGDWWSTEPDVGRVVARISPWLDGGLDASSEGTDEIVRALRDANGSRSLWWTLGGSGGLQAPDVLLTELCEYAGPPKPLGNISLAGSEASGVVMRSVWFNGETACPSCRRRSEEQRCREHPDLVHLVSRLLACDCGSTRLDRAGTPSESSRVNRLRCLGNAVVPQVAEYIGNMIMEYET